MTALLDRTDVSVDLQHRVVGEYVYLPGLCLTVPQAARLFAVSHSDSRQALERLVEAAFLQRDGACYVRTESSLCGE